MQCCLFHLIAVAHREREKKMNEKTYIFYAAAAAAFRMYNK